MCLVESWRMPKTVDAPIVKVLLSAAGRVVETLQSLANKDLHLTRMLIKERRKKVLDQHGIEAHLRSKIGSLEASELRSDRLIELLPKNVTLAEVTKAIDNLVAEGFLEMVVRVKSPDSLGSIEEIKITREGQLPEAVANWRGSGEMVPVDEDSTDIVYVVH